MPDLDERDASVGPKQPGHRSQPLPHVDDTAGREALRAAIEHFERSPRWPALASALDDLGVLSPREEALELLGRALWAPTWPASGRG